MAVDHPISDKQMHKGISADVNSRGPAAKVEQQLPKLPDSWEDDWEEGLEEKQPEISEKGTNPGLSAGAPNSGTTAGDGESKTAKTREDEKTVALLDWVAGLTPSPVPADLPLLEPSAGGIKRHRLSPNERTLLFLNVLHHSDPRPKDWAIADLGVGDGRISLRNCPKRVEGRVWALTGRQPQENAGRSKLWDTRFTSVGDLDAAVTQAGTSLAFFKRHLRRIDVLSEQLLNKGAGHGLGDADVDLMLLDYGNMVLSYAVAVLEDRAQELQETTVNALVSPWVLTGMERKLDTRYQLLEETRCSLEALDSESELSMRDNFNW